MLGNQIYGPSKLDPQWLYIKYHGTIIQKIKWTMFNFCRDNGYEYTIGNIWCIFYYKIVFKYKKSVSINCLGIPLFGMFGKRFSLLIEDMKNGN